MSAAGSRGSDVSPEATQLVRLLGATVELVAEAALADVAEPAFLRAMLLAAEALVAVSPEGDPDVAERALRDLSAVVSTLVDSWA